MSRERELLKECRLMLDNPFNGTAGLILRNRIDDYFDQPEQEPVAWMSLSDIEWMNIVNHPKILELTDGRHNSEEAVNLAVKMTEEKCKKNNSDSIPKREPLSDDEIESIWGQDSLGSTVEFVRAIEKAHGIGGGE